MTITANFTGQSLPFPCITMAKVILSYAKATSIQEIFLPMVDVDPSKKHLMNTSHLTLTNAKAQIF